MIYTVRHQSKVWSKGRGGESIPPSSIILDSNPTTISSDSDLVPMHSRRRRRNRYI